MQNMKKPTIVIVEDELDIQEMIALSLETANIKTLKAYDGREGFEICVNVQPDLVLIDWMMPGVNGIELLRRLRKDERTQNIPAIMLTAKIEIDNKAQGLDEGADDYITKPFSPKELISRINAVLRRADSDHQSSALSIADLSLDLESHSASISGQVLKMGAIEFKLLNFFLKNPDKVFSREQLLNNIWGSNVYIDERTVDVHIRRLRKVLSVDGHEKLVQTVHGAGYRFSEKFPKS
jgi:two-component system phosphate regulon response regulator PhoB